MKKQTIRVTVNSRLIWTGEMPAGGLTIEDGEKMPGLRWFYCLCKRNPVGRPKSYTAEQWAEKERQRQHDYLVQNREAINAKQRARRKAAKLKKQQDPK